MTKIFVRVVLPVIAGVLLFAGCSNTKTGTATPVGGESSNPPAQSTSSGATTAAIDPCSLLSAADLASYGSVSGPEVKTLGDARVCNFQKKTTSSTDVGFVIGVAIRDTAGVDSVNDVGGGVQDKSVNGRNAKEASDGQMGCTLALAVGTSSRVDVVISGIEASKGCGIVEKVAETAVEPKLPKG